MSDSVRWLSVACAVIEHDGGLLLVRESARGETEANWAIPGGVVEPGELAHEAAAREVEEETALVTLEIGRLLWTTEVQGPLSSVTFVFEAQSDPTAVLTGDGDPDLVISEVAFVPLNDAIALLGQQPMRSMAEPAVAVLADRSLAGSLWSYRQEDSGQQQLVATR